MLVLAQISVSEALRLTELMSGELARSVLFGAVIGPYEGLGTHGSMIRCSGASTVFDRLLPILSSLGSVRYVGKNPVMSVLLESVVSGVHYSTLASLLTGMGLCEEYGLPLDVYVEKVCEGMPSLSQGAYRSIWSGLASSRDFDDVDDDIHAMEMLVCELRRSGADVEIASDERRQRELNRVIRRYWHAVEAKVLGSEARDV